MSRTVYVNGDFLPEQEASISIFDRGFLFADGVYEVTAVVDGHMLDFEPHMDRLQRSLGEISLESPYDRDTLRAMHEELIARNQLDQGLIYMHITRGPADRDFHYPKQPVPTLIGFTQASNLVDNPKAVSGIKVASVPDIRWARRDIKSIALLAQAMAKQAAADKGASEAWMVEDGFVTEGSSSTAYIVKGGRIITRQLSQKVLAGITRRALLKLAEQENVEIEQRPFTLDEAKGADEAFLSSASTLVFPVIEIDGVPIGDGTPGPIARKLRRIYLELARRRPDSA